MALHWRSQTSSGGSALAEPVPHKIGSAVPPCPVPCTVCHWLCQCCSRKGRGTTDQVSRGRGPTWDIIWWLCTGGASATQDWLRSATLPGAVYRVPLALPVLQQERTRNNRPGIERERAHMGHHLVALHWRSQCHTRLAPQCHPARCRVLCATGFASAAAGKDEEQPTRYREGEGPHGTSSGGSALAEPVPHKIGSAVPPCPVPCTVCHWLCQCCSRKGRGTTDQVSRGRGPTWNIIWWLCTGGASAPQDWLRSATLPGAVYCVPLALPVLQQERTRNNRPGIERERAHMGHHLVALHWRSQCHTRLAPQCHPARCRVPCATGFASAAAGKDEEQPTRYREGEGPHGTSSGGSALAEPVPHKIGSAVPPCPVPCTVCHWLCQCCSRKGRGITDKVSRGRGPTWDIIWWLSTGRASATQDWLRSATLPGAVYRVPLALPVLQQERTRNNRPGIERERAHMEHHLVALHWRSQCHTRLAPQCHPARCRVLCATGFASAAAGKDEEQPTRYREGEGPHGTSSGGSALAEPVPHKIGSAVPPCPVPCTVCHWLCQCCSRKGRGTTDQVSRGRGPTWDIIWWLCTGRASATQDWPPDLWW